MFYVIMLGFISGCLGTLLGGIIGIFINSNSRKVYVSILEFTAGLMLSIVCFELLPEAMLISNIFVCLIGFSIGAILMTIIDNYIYNKNKKLNSQYLLGLMVFISIAIHNFPEGLAIGASHDVSSALGISIFISIFLHDIPEGISITLPMKKDRSISKTMLLFYPFISGIPTAIGAGIGYFIGGISNIIVSLCLSIAGGVMIYVVLGDIIPESKTMYKGRISVFANILGILTGIIVSYL